MAKTFKSFLAEGTKFNRNPIVRERLLNRVKSAIPNKDPIVPPDSKPKPAATNDHATDQMPFGEGHNPNAAHEIEWLKKQIKKLEQEKHPNLKQIANYKHQIKHTELSNTFDPEPAKRRMNESYRPEDIEPGEIHYLGRGKDVRPTDTKNKHYYFSHHEKKGKALFGHEAKDIAKHRARQYALHGELEHMQE